MRKADVPCLRQMSATQHPEKVLTYCREMRCNQGVLNFKKLFSVPLQAHFMSAHKTRLALLLAACSLMASLAVKAQTTETAASHVLTPLTAVTVTAEPAAPGKPVVHRQADAAFDRADSNHDGMLSRAEAERLPAISLRFDELDVNKDQMLSREEFDNALKY